MVIFAPHNLANDPPFSKIDLITCRNLLIYLQANLQKKIFSTFGFALNPEGFLFLGPSESLSEYSEEFITVDTKWKIYRYKGISRSTLLTERLSSDFLLDKRNKLTVPENTDKAPVKPLREDRILNQSFRLSWKITTFPVWLLMNLPN